MLYVIENAICQYIEPEKSEIGGINSGINGGLNVIQREIIPLIRENPHIRAFEIAQKLLKPVRTIENNLSRLKEKGIISRNGSKKTGYWKIME